MAEGKSGQQTVDILQKRVEDLGAVKTGNYTVDCETYQAVQSSSEFMHLYLQSKTESTTY